jgi:hypothetical protein
MPVIVIDKHTQKRVYEVQTAIIRETTRAALVRINGEVGPDYDSEEVLDSEYIDSDMDGYEDEDGKECDAADFEFVLRASENEDPDCTLGPLFDEAASVTGNQ